MFYGQSTRFLDWLSCSVGELSPMMLVDVSALLLERYAVRENGFTLLLLTIAEGHQDPALTDVHLICGCQVAHILTISSNSNILNVVVIRK